MVNQNKYQNVYANEYFDQIFEFWNGQDGVVWDEVQDQSSWANIQLTNGVPGVVRIFGTPPANQSSWGFYCYVTDGGAGYATYSVSGLILPDRLLLTASPSAITLSKVPSSIKIRVNDATQKARLSFNSLDFERFPSSIDQICEFPLEDIITDLLKKRSTESTWILPNNNTVQIHRSKLIDKVDFTYKLISATGAILLTRTISSKHFILGDLEAFQNQSTFLADLYNNLKPLTIAKATKVIKNGDYIACSFLCNIADEEYSFWVETTNKDMSVVRTKISDFVTTSDSFQITDFIFKFNYPDAISAKIFLQVGVINVDRLFFNIQIQLPARFKTATFIYHNSVGALESFTAFGAMSIDRSSKKTTFEKKRTQALNIHNPMIVVTDLENEYQNEINTGFMSVQQMLDLKELIDSEKVYIVRDNTLYPIIITNKKLPLVDEFIEQSNYQFTITWINAYK